MLRMYVLESVQEGLGSYLCGPPTTIGPGREMPLPQGR